MPLLGVVFDFDGVIADTEPLHLRAYQDVLADISLTLDTEAYYARYLGYDDVGVFTAVGRDQGAPIEGDSLQRLVNLKSGRFEALVGDADVLFPGAAACIERLAATVPLAIASGALHVEIDAILSSSHLNHHFKAIVAADDVAQSKPAPDSYLLAVERLGGDRARVSPVSFVAIEDSRWGIEAAHAAGLACVAVTHSYPADALTTADLVVAELAEVQPALLKRLGARGDRRASHQKRETPDSPDADA